MSEKLVILDINGVLANKKSSKKSFNFGWSFNPKYQEFLESLSKKYKVAIWTSTTKDRALPIVEKIIECVDNDNLYFIWYGEDTPKGPAYDGYSNFQTIKPLNSVINPIREDLLKGVYNENNILIVDDDISKMHGNDPKNFIIFNHKNKNLEELLNDIDERFKFLDDQ